MSNETVEILSRAKELFSRYGVRSISMDDVASELGRSKKTIYQHVSNKEDLLRKLFLWEFEQIQARFADIYNRNLNAIDEMVEIHKFIASQHESYNAPMEYDLKKYYPALFHEIIHTAHATRRKTLIANMEKGKREGLYRPDIVPEAIAMLYFSGFECQKPEGIDGCQGIPARTILREAFLYHLHGICSPKGLELLYQRINEFKIKES